MHHLKHEQHEDICILLYVRLVLASALPDGSLIAGQQMYPITDLKADTLETLLV